MRYRGCLEQFERDAGMPIMKHPARPTIFGQTAVCFTWVDKMVRNPAILDVVEDIIGPNIRVFHTNIFVKEPHSPEFISWHQDGAYNAISPPEVFTTWVALSDATPEMGCMRMLKGSHKLGLRIHADIKTAHNLLSRGQRIDALEDAGHRRSRPAGWRNVDTSFVCRSFIRTESLIAAAHRSHDHLRSNALPLHRHWSSAIPRGARARPRRTPPFR